MTTLAERAHANAERARSAQDASGATRHVADMPEPIQPYRAHWWRVWTADDTVVDVCVYPPLTRDEVQGQFYPTAKSVLLHDRR